MIICNQCGNQCSENDKFCVSCGHPIEPDKSYDPHEPSNSLRRICSSKLMLAVAILLSVALALNLWTAVFALPFLNLIDYGTESMDKYFNEFYDDFYDDFYADGSYADDGIDYYGGYAGEDLEVSVADGMRTALFILLIPGVIQLLAAWGIYIGAKKDPEYAMPTWGFTLMQVYYTVLGFVLALFTALFLASVFLAQSPEIHPLFNVAIVTVAVFLVPILAFSSVVTFALASLFASYRRIIKTGKPKTNTLYLVAAVFICVFTGLAQVDGQLTGYVICAASIIATVCIFKVHKEMKRLSELEALRKRYVTDSTAENDKEQQV